MPLDTDVANPDAGLHVTFYLKKDSTPPNREYCRIAAPGDPTSVWDQPATDDERVRFARHYAAFRMAQNPAGQAFGTALEEWQKADPTALTDNQIVDLRYHRFQTVEQIAGAPDSAMQFIGLGAEGLRERARLWLRERNKTLESKELDETKAALAELQRQMAQLMTVHTSAVSAAQTMSVSVADEPELTPAQARMAKARAARKVNRGKHAPPVGAASDG